MKENTLLLIVGPTAIGKTELAIEISEFLNTEIISCDSRQIYKEMQIGTARPTVEQLQKVKHHFIATHSVCDYYNASMFEVDVLKLLDDLFKKKKTIVMVGGSGLYADAVCKGIDDLPTVDAEVRKELLKRYKEEGISSLRHELLKIDPEYCKNADIRNPKRVLKALEVFHMTGKPYSLFLTNPKKERHFDILKIGLNRDRRELYEMIDQRVALMIKNGLIEEVKSLITERSLNALNTVGYKELFDYFDGNLSIEKAEEMIKQNSRRYAKRQLTWFNRDKEISWFHPENKKEIFLFIESKLKL